jgi:ubiquinone/menaquinone biosynthesis C-methylase UbiE
MKNANISSLAGEVVESAGGDSGPKRVVERGYDRVAHEYARLEGESEWPRMRWVRKLLNRLESGSSVLDLGCGSGDPADVEISKEHKVTGVDISQTQINLARQNVPTGHFLHGDAGSVEFPPNSFDAVISFYTLEHIPREEHKTILRRIYQWLRVGGFLLMSIEAGEFDDVMGQWLGVPMFISCFDPESMKQMVNEAGFELFETAIETQVEQGNDVPYLWLLARKR